MRFVVDLYHTGDGVEGEVTREGGNEPQSFTSWLDLLRLLEEDAPQQRRPFRGKGHATMPADVDQLVDINERIGTAESDGDVESLGSALAPVLGFRRASGACIDRRQFLDSVAPGPPRTTRVESVELLDRYRAVVRCVVEMTDGAHCRAYDNVRLFVRVDGDWKLLGWANAERSS
jgi:hypothetical protein